MSTAQPQPTHAESVSPGAIILLLVAFGGAGFGTLLMSQATAGVGLICGACFLAIFARILQAGAHHKVEMRARTSAQVF